MESIHDNSMGAHPTDYLNVQLSNTTGIIGTSLIPAFLHLATFKLITFFQPVEENVNHLVEALRDAGRNPDAAAPQIALINASKEFIQVVT